MLVFGEHRLDIGRRELRRGAELILLEPKVFDLLAFLVLHRDRVVTKDDLLQGVWGGRIVSESAVTTRINAVRRALGDDGATQRLVRTFTRKGIRFVGRVIEVSDREVPPAADKPSIAVLPFANLTGDPRQDYFVDGMVAEIITALSRIRSLFVIARNSSFSYRGQSADVKQVGRELGVRYVLEGSVRKSGNRLRISGQLIDAVSGAHLWADRFDGLLEDVLDLQDRIASSVAGVIEPALQAAETARSASRPTTDLSARDLYFRAVAMFIASSRRIPEALALMREAIDRDPHYGPALGLAAALSYRMLNDGLSEDREGDRARGIDFARRALEVGDDDPGILVNAALSLAWLGEDIGAMIALGDRALAINPNFARGWDVGGVLRCWAGELDGAIEYLETALHLSPRARVGQTLHHIGMTHFFAGRFDQAEPKLLLALQDDPSFPTTPRVLAACYAHMGRLDEARVMISRLRAITPVLLPREPPLRNLEHPALVRSGLRLALGESNQCA